MKRILMLAGAGAAATGLVSSMLVVGPAVAADQPCAEMGDRISILNESTPTCVMLYTSGSSSIVVPADGPRIIYGVVNMPPSGGAPTTFTGRNGVTYQLNDRQSQRWDSVSVRTGSQTIVRAEIVNGKIGQAIPYLYIADDAITDRFEKKSFIGRAKNGEKAKKPLSIWTRIDWASGTSSDGGLRGAMVNYRINVKDAGQCKPAMVPVNPDRVKQRFGKGGKVELVWSAGQGANSLLVMTTQTQWRFTHPVPSALKLTQKVWKPGKLFFKLSGSDGGIISVGINDIRKESRVRECTLP
jgi:hypothetical protein